MAASELSPSSGKYSEDPTDVTPSHRLRLLQSKPKRRHSIQVVSGFPFLSRQPSFGHGSVTPENTSTTTNASGNTSDITTHNKGRRQSISESLQFVTKSMSSSLKKAVHLGSNPSLDHGYHFSSYGGNDARFLTKGFFRDILSAHYRQTDLKITKFSMRTWSGEEILRSTNSNSIVMDLLLVGDTYGCDGDSSSKDRRRSQIILSQKQYKDRLSESYRSNSIHCENMPSIEEGAVLVQTHPVYEVIHEVELITKMMESGKSLKKKLKLTVKCLRNTRDRQRIGSQIPTSPTTSRTDADDLEEVEEDNEQQDEDKLERKNQEQNSETRTSSNTSFSSNGAGHDTKHPSTSGKSKNLQSFTENLESRKNSAISVESKDKEQLSRKSSVDLIKGDTNSSEHSSRQDSLTDVSLTAYHQRKFEAEREYKVYTQVIQDMWDYLCDEKEIERPEELIGLPIRYQSDPKLLLLSDLVESDEGDEGGAEFQGLKDGCTPFTHLILQDLFASDFQMAEIDRDENGLDFTHTILALAKLATFHAVSYCMKKEKNIDLHERYPFLKEDSVYRPATSKVFARMQSNMTTRLRKVFFGYENGVGSTGDFVSEAEANRFLQAVNNMHAVAAELVTSNEKFGVICHGDLWRQNVLFSYDSCLENQSDSIGVRFDDLHLCRYSSCVTDILYFLFTTVDCDVRRDHAVNFIAAYYDHFNKTVRILAPKLLPIFTRDELLSEFRRLLMFGFLEGLCLFSSVFETQMRRAGLTVTDLENMEREEEERANAEAKIDPRDRTWSGMVVNDPSNSNLGIGCIKDTRPRYSDYRDSVVAIVTDVVRFRAQLPVGKVDSHRKESDPGTDIRNKHDDNSPDKKSLLITAL